VSPRRALSRSEADEARSWCGRAAVLARSIVLVGSCRATPAQSGAASATHEHAVCTIDAEEAGPLEGPVTQFKRNGTLRVTTGKCPCVASCRMSWHIPCPFLTHGLPSSARGGARTGPGWPSKTRCVTLPSMGRGAPPPPAVSRSVRRNSVPEAIRPVAWQGGGKAISCESR
jgi:hypothetical protein